MVVWRCFWFIIKGISIEEGKKQAHKKALISGFIVSSLRSDTTVLQTADIVLTLDLCSQIWPTLV